MAMDSAPSAAGGVSNVDEIQMGGFELNDT